jgi:hypothetical protein
MPPYRSKTKRLDIATPNIGRLVFVIRTQDASFPFLRHLFNPPIFAPAFVIAVNPVLPRLAFCLVDGAQMMPFVAFA